MAFRLVIDSGTCALSPADSGDRRLITRRRLTTAEILYHMPDHPGLLQVFVWQCMDRAPNYPRLTRFLDYWCRNLDGVLHTVRVAQARNAASGGMTAASDLRTLPPARTH